MAPTGIALARRFYTEIVGPLLRRRWPGLPHAAARIGTGSDVLGLDDEMSRDHDWGLRLTVLVPPRFRRPVEELLDDELPQTFAGLPVAFAFSGSPDVRHRVEVESPGGFATARLGIDPRAGLTVLDWLTFTGQSVLEVTAGAVFADTDGALTDIRAALTWYPDDVWRYVVACDWQRLDEEMPLMSRAADRGDDLGSRLIAARLVDVTIHLGFLLERRWPPYAKWRGTMFATLPRVGAALPQLAAVLDSSRWPERQSYLARALELLSRVQADAGLPSADAPTAAFWGRPYLHVAPGLADSILAEVTDESVRALPPGLGSIEQRCNNVNLLVDARHRRHHLRSDAR